MYSKFLQQAQTRLKSIRSARRKNTRMKYQAVKFNTKKKCTLSHSLEGLSSRMYWMTLLHDAKERTRALKKEMKNMQGRLKEIKLKRIQLFLIYVLTFSS
jgi:hypothetical protein